MGNKIKQLAIALKLADPDGTLSLSNVAMFTVIGKLATMVQPDLAVLTAFGLALLNYNAKKFNIFKTKKVADQSEADKTKEQARIQRIEDELKNLINAQSFKNLGR